MNQEPIFGRIVTAVVTPFDSRGNIDYVSAKYLVGHLADNGSDAVVVAGTTGEGAALSEEERIELFTFWRENAPEKMKVIANTGTNVTKDSVALTEAATKAGVEKRLKFTIHTPLAELTKAQIIRRGTELGVDYGLTHSCYDPDASGVSCGRCDACRLRRNGFAEAGLEDPLPYQVAR